MAKPPAFQMYAADFLNDTAEWTNLEVGIYTRLLMYEWINGSLPTDFERLGRLCGLQGEQVEMMWDTIGPKFTSNGDGRLHNNRMEKVRDLQHARRDVKSKAGSKGAAKRWDHSAIGMPLAKGMAEGMAKDGSSSSATDKTDANASGRNAEAVKAEQDLLVWDYGVTMLMLQGMGERNARSLLGKLIKLGGAELVANKLKDAQFESPVDLAAWLTAVVTKKPASAVGRVDAANEPENEPIDVD